MSTQNWGLLPKSQVDDETVEEAISRLILAHAQDPESHLGAGESLQSHKASEIIDHLAESIVNDKLADFSVDYQKLVGNAFLLNTNFESVDGWGTDWDSGGGLYCSLFGSRLETGNVDGDFASMFIEPAIGANVLNFSKNPVFQFTANFYVDDKQTITFGLGESKRACFKYENEILYAVTNDGVEEHTSVISGVSVNEYNIYRIVVDSGSGTIKFYVNEVLKATMTEDLPSGAEGFVCLIDIFTGENVQKALYFSNMFFSQPK
jgi:hypothetical protein